MRSYIYKRLLLLIPTVILLSFLAYALVELPPGDYATTYAGQLTAKGISVTSDMVSNLQVRYGLDKPMVERYVIWIVNIFKGDLGFSPYFNLPVKDVLGKPLLFSLGMSLASLIISYALAVPIGIFSAVKQNSVGDYVVTLIGYAGLSIPSFLLALVMLYLNAKYFGTSIGGLFSSQYADAAWSGAKFVDLLKHVWVPVAIIALQGTASIIRTVRANLLDELKKPYVELERAKGLSEVRLITKYPLRIAINPVISSFAWLLPSLISGSTIVEIVLAMPTTGPIFLQSLKFQDMSLACTFILFTGILTVLSTLLSDILLAVLDPRIRYS